MSDGIAAAKRQAISEESRYLGCLLGGAVGDALGAAVEFMPWHEIEAKFGSKGITQYEPAYGRRGAITDDTQMTLFTAEGLIRALVRQRTKGICHPPSVVAHAYQRWLHTQRRQNSHDLGTDDGWLIQNRELHSQRAPGVTCLSALESMSYFGELAQNNSKGCGGVMRVAPIALVNPIPSSDWAFETAAEVCSLTHGHPSGQLAGGFLAATLTEIRLGNSLLDAIEISRELASGSPGHEEVLEKADQAIQLAQSNPMERNAIGALGEGWLAEEALAIGLYCALSTDNTIEGVTLAVNHGGDSDSTGAITGNILGLIYGVESIPDNWLKDLELESVIRRIALDLLHADQIAADELWDRYPGH